jgi:hypothetical protein
MYYIVAHIYCITTHRRDQISSSQMKSSYWNKFHIYFLVKTEKAINIIVWLKIFEANINKSKVSTLL